MWLCPVTPGYSRILTINAGSEIYVNLICGVVKYLAAVNDYAFYISSCVFLFVKVMASFYYCVEKVYCKTMSSGVT